MKSLALSRILLTRHDREHPSTGDERRASSRRISQIELEFTEDSEFFTGLSQDISEGGLFVATYYVFPVGTRLALSFELPDGTPVDARGEVRWARNAERGDSRPGLGIAFTELTEAAREGIARYCARRPPLYVDF